ncbi:MAG: hypothetical protein ACFFKA_00710 [Candidatus Thorarchaeota archaeon]
MKWGTTTLDDMEKFMILTMLNITDEDLCNSVLVIRSYSESRKTIIAEGKVRGIDARPYNGPYILVDFFLENASENLEQAFKIINICRESEYYLTNMLLANAVRCSFEYPNNESNKPIKDKT